MLATLTALVLAMVFGARHALEPDHLAAVGTLVASGRGGARDGAWLGAWWGLGHTAGLSALGGVLILLQAQLPEPVAQALELMVAVMLMGLGLRAIRAARRDALDGPFSVHRHGRAQHGHRTGGDHLHLPVGAYATRPFLVGCMHGLAGSGALVALVLVELQSAWERAAFLAMCGLGSVLGMAALTALVMPLAGRGHAALVRGLTVGSGVLSCAVGASHAYGQLVGLG